MMKRPFLFEGLGKSGFGFFLLLGGKLIFEGGLDEAVD